MQIHIKQAEIQEALKQYLVNKGIKVDGGFSVAFSTTRKPTQVVADITLGEVEIPGFSNQLELELPMPATEPDADEKPAEQQEPAVAPEPAVDPQPEAPVADVTSLFRQQQ